MNKNLTIGNQKIASLFDSGTFVEIGAYIKRCGSQDTYDGIICGYGSISGKLAYAFVQDSDRLKGAFDSTGAKKIGMLYDMAIKNGAPVIGVFDSAGAVVFDGSAALSAYGSFLSNVAKASGIVPQIAVINGVCTGLSLTASAMFDFTVTVEGKSQMYLTPSANKDGKKVPEPAIKAQDEASAFSYARKLAEILPLNNNDSASVEITDSMNRVSAPEGLTGRALVESLCDNGDFTVLYGESGKELVCGFAFFGGELAGVVASDYAENKGKLTCKGAKKAASFISFCDRFGISVLTFVDTEGFSENICASSAAELTTAYANSDCAKVTVVTGKAYGAGFTLLGSKSIGADLEIALPGAVISVMPPESAVAFIMNDEISPEKSRADVEREWNEKYASAVLAAEKGDIDDIVAPEELRARICAALCMLASKADTYPERKHFRMPL